MRIAELRGKIKDYPLQAQGEVRLEDQLLAARKFQLEVGNNRIRLDGVADEATGLSWILDAPNLEALHLQLSGQLRGGARRVANDGSTAGAANWIS
ncbi:MAG: hypothetical protein R3E89_12060 [Thiolinea sp.]